MERKAFSYDLEKQYYSARWPREAQPYRHLEKYLRCWMDPEAVFPGRRILDIGAGESTYTRMIADAFRPRRIVACDLFRERMTPASGNNANAALSFVSGDVFCLPFAGGSFDVLFGSFILHQIPDLARIAAEIRRVLAAGGCYVGIEPNPHHPVHLYRFYRGLRSRNQYLLGPKHLEVFRNLGFDLSVRFFYARWPWLRNRLLATCMGIMATRRKTDLS